MADGKRNSVGGKVATPKPGAQTMQDTLEALKQAVGARITLTTIPPHSQTLEGHLFTADPFLNVVAINTTPAPPNPSTSLASQPGDYHIIPVKHISDFKVLSLGTENGDGWSGAAAPEVKAVDLKKLEARLQSTVNRLKEAEQRKGKGVTSEGQAVFDALHRMYPNTRWHEQSIIVMDSVIISPPYRVEDAKAPKDKTEALERIRRVLEGERRKIAARSAATTPTPPSGQRKGG